MQSDASLAHGDTVEEVKRVKTGRAPVRPARPVDSTLHPMVNVLIGTAVARDSDRCPQIMNYTSPIDLMDQQTASRPKYPRRI